jgi:hypothetical protein
MNYLFVILIAVLWPFVPSQPAQQESQRQTNRPPVISSFSSSRRLIEVCPFSEHFPKPHVDLLVIASDPDGDSLVYEYSITEGAISGKGRQVIWDLDRALRGPHEVRVTVTDGKGGKATDVLSVTTVDAGACDPPLPPCPLVKVSIVDPTKLLQAKADLARWDEKISSQLIPKLSGWRYKRGEIFVSSSNSFVQHWTTTGRVVTVRVAVPESLEDAKSEIKSFLESRFKPETLSGIGDEAYAPDTYNVVLRRGRFVIYISTDVFVGDDPDESTLSTDQIFARRKTEAYRIGREFAKHLSSIELE